MEFAKEFWAFIKSRKKFWLIPLFILLLTLGLLIFVSSGSVLAPFVYTLF